MRGEAGLPSLSRRLRSGPESSMLRESPIMGSPNGISDFRTLEPFLGCQARSHTFKSSSFSVDHTHTHLSISAAGPEGSCLLPSAGRCLPWVCVHRQPLVAAGIAPSVHDFWYRRAECEKMGADVSKDHGGAVWCAACMPCGPEKVGRADCEEMDDEVPSSSTLQLAHAKASAWPLHACDPRPFHPSALFCTFILAAASSRF